MKKKHHFTFDNMPDHSEGTRNVGLNSVSDTTNAQGVRRIVSGPTSKSPFVMTIEMTGQKPNKEIDLSFDSECLESGTYNPHTKELSLTFVGHSEGSQGTWNYSDVPADVVKRLQEDDTGEVFNEEIRGVYED